MSQGPCAQFQYNEIEKSGQQLGSTGKLRTSFCATANGSFSRGPAGRGETNSPFFVLQFMTKNPSMRLGSPALGGESAILRHPYFKELDWDLLNQRQMEPPFRPRIVREREGWRKGSCYFIFPPLGVLSTFIAVRLKRGGGKATSPWKLWPGSQEVRPTVLAWLLVGHTVLYRSLFPSMLDFQSQLNARRCRFIKADAADQGLCLAQIKSRVRNPHSAHSTCLFGSDLHLYITSVFVSLGTAPSRVLPAQASIG